MSLMYEIRKLVLFCMSLIAMGDEEGFPEKGQTTRKRKIERERDRQTGRQRQRETQRDTEIQWQRQRQGGRDRKGKETERENLNSLQKLYKLGRENAKASKRENKRQGET